MSLHKEVKEIGVALPITAVVLGIFILGTITIREKYLKPIRNNNKLIECAYKCNEHVNDQIKKLECNPSYMYDKRRIKKQLTPCLEQCKKKYIPKKETCIYNEKD